MKYHIKSLRLKGHTIEVKSNTVTCTNCMFQDIATFTATEKTSAYQIVYLLYIQL
jgi:hypothetical protein